MNAFSNIQFVVYSFLDNCSVSAAEIFHRIMTWQVLLVMYKIPNKVCTVLLRGYKCVELHHHSPTLLHGEMYMYRDNSTFHPFISRKIYI
jgi:hypothetical protein